MTHSSHIRMIVTHWTQDMQDTLRACEMDADEASADNEEEEDGVGHCNELFNKLELWEVSILRRMAKK